MPCLQGLVGGPANRSPSRLDGVGATAVLAMGQLALQDAEAAHEVRALLVNAVDDLQPHSCEPRARLPVVPLHARSRLRAAIRSVATRLRGIRLSGARFQASPNFAEQGVESPGRDSKRPRLPTVDKKQAIETACR